MMSNNGFLFQLDTQWVYLKILPKKWTFFFCCGIRLVETRLQCNFYLFAFNLRLFIKLNINCGFEYKNGYLSFRLKGLSYRFSIDYFDKISGKIFCEKIKFYRQIIHKYMLCVILSVPITIVITTLTTHNIKIPWMVHHIQTKRLTHLWRHKNPSPKHRKSKHLYKKKITK
jgi:hypothetical protein